MTPGPDDQSLRYDVDGTFDLSAIPELVMAADAENLTETTGPERSTVQATLFDTVDRQLLAAGVEIRRQTGSDVDGWHLRVMLPGSAPHDARLALGRSERTVPIQFRRLTWVHARGATLQPVAQLTTDREVRRFGVDGASLVEIALDRVQLRPVVNPPESSSEERAAASSWLELQVSVDGDDEVLRKRVDRQLRRLGARRVTPGSRRQIAPASSVGTGQAGAGGQGDSKSKKAAKKPVRERFSPMSPSKDVIVAYLAQERDRLIAEDIPVRLDRPDALHQMRVATRRLRGALQTFAALFDAEVIEPLRAELKWLAAELGAARDAEVLRERLLDAVTLEQAQHLAAGAVTRSVDRETRRSQREAFAAVRAALDSDRYRALITVLDAVVSSPPTTAKAQRSARKQLRRPVAEASARVHKALAQADKQPAGAEREVRLHAARKAAKRARYAAEAVTPAFGKEARAFGAAMEHLQDVLGEHHDRVVTQARLHELALAGTPAVAFSLGRLHAQQGEQQAAAESGVARAITAAEKKSLRGWLT